MKHRPLLVCVSGPDGAGKSSLVGRMATHLRGHGYTVATQYCYGCVICRRLPQRIRSRFIASPGKPRSIASRIGTLAGRLHGWVDVAELTAVLAGATVRAHLTSRGGPAAVVTDRGPLDGLVKFAPAPGSRLAAAFARLAATYEITLLLDAEPEVLAQRDGEYATGPLRKFRDRYRQWATRLPSVRLVNADAPPGAVAAEALGCVPTLRQATAASAGPPPAGGDSGKQVVISIFDDLRNPHYHGGGALLVDKVARRLAEDHPVTVVTVAGRGGVETRDGVRYHRLPFGWAGPRLGQLLYHAVLPVTARRLPHDVWLESFTPPFSTSFLPLFSRSRVVGVAQSLSGAAMSRRYRLPFVLVERYGLRFYEDIVVLNEADAATVRRHAPRAVTHVIHNGVDQPPFVPRRIGEGDYIAFLGRVDIWEKGLDLLLTAHAGAPSMPLLLAGAGARGEEAGLTALIDATGADARWVGEVTGAEKQRFLEDCAFLVLPSRSESFGLVALEAMAYGKPVLHFDLPTLRWMDGGGNVTVPAFDVAALGQRLRALAADEESRRHLGQLAHQAARWFSWERTTGQYLSLVQELLERPGATGSAAATAVRAAERKEARSWQPIH
ncbi:MULTISPECIES: glycosyltransferase [unclassified Streptomyces]|uniref:glycosyltransferase n=1 Tax=unclassified Streptomyces TaxID=2593676 RepID=UPI0033AD8C61